MISLLIINIVIIFLIKKIKKDSLNKTFVIDKKFVLITLCLLVANYFLLKKIKIFYLCLFYFSFNIITIHLRKSLLILYYSYYFEIKFFYNREFEKYWFFDISKNQYLKKLFVILLFVIFYFYINITIYLLALLFFSGINMNILESKFDQAILNKQNYFDIVLFDSGKEKLELYKKYILNPEGSEIRFYFNFDHDLNIDLIWGEDYLYVDSFHNEMHLNNCI